MVKKPITELEIHVYTCVSDPSRMALARIGNLPIEFKAPTPMGARKAADDWRKEEHARLTKKGA